MNHILPTLMLAGTALLGVSGAAAQTPAGQGSNPAGQTPTSQYPNAQGSGGQSQGAGGQNHGAGGQSQGAGQRNSGAAGASGQSTQGQYPDARMSGKSGSAITVTGCLAQGDGPNEFSLKDSGGKTYGLMAGSGVNLKSHLGHQVSVTGTSSGMEGKGSDEHGGAAGSQSRQGAGSQANSKAGSSRMGEESQHLQVSDVKMISNSCQ